MNGMIDIDALRRDYPLPAVAASALKLVSAGGEWKACCPFHADRSPSFTIYRDKKSGHWKAHCFAGCFHGDVIDFICRLYGVGLRGAADMLGATNLPSVSVRSPQSVGEGPDRTEEARTIWRNAAPVEGTPAESYLRARGLHLTIPASFRFARLPYGKRGRLYPCIVAAVASVDNRLIGIQRTYLNDAGTGKAAVPKPKLSLGHVSGGAIRLAPAAAEMAVCEGAEDGLTLMQELGRAVWVAAGASMLPNMLFPDGVRSVVIGADGDEAGEAAARKAGSSFTGRGLSSRIIRPLDGFKDFNDELRGVGA